MLQKKRKREKDFQGFKKGIKMKKVAKKDLEQWGKI